MKINCPYEDCAQRIEIDINHAGTEAKCPNCTRPFMCPNFNEFPPNEQGLLARNTSNSNKLDHGARTKSAKESILKKNIGMAPLACPRCGDQKMKRQKPGCLMMGMFGMFASAFAGRECQYCGPIKLREFPSGAQTRIVLGKIFLFLIYIIIAVVVLTILGEIK